MTGRKRVRPEVGNNFDEYEDSVKKCFYCQHCYVRRKNADEWLCSKRKGCKFKSEKNVKVVNLSLKIY